ncbi:NF-kappa-B inhibitor zeta [Eucyclogobius newberryi]|uniref:NF-kappa-B inhibitor zeta n=1 Tax=Eucyclogobius newberryi TaxID=166745 RepID=UPI003B5AA990
MISDPAKAQALAHELSVLLAKGAIKAVDPLLQPGGYYSTHFLVPKKTGGFRPILDIRGLNHFLKENSYWSFLSEDNPGHEVQMGPERHKDLSPPQPLSAPFASRVDLPEPACLVGSSPEVPVATLFHWQVQQQFSKLKGVPPEMHNMRDSDGDTLLHIAVAQGKRALAYVLAANMSVSGTLDSQERNGQTALHIAAATNQHLIVSDLLEHGAQVHTWDSWGRSPLHVCVEKGHVHSLLAMSRTFRTLGKELDVDMVNYDGLTSLHVAVLAHNATLRKVSNLEQSGSGKERDDLLKKGHRFFECIKALLQMGASSETKDQKSGRTSLHMAAEEANTQLFPLFLTHPSSLSMLNLRTFSGNTALHVVCALEGCRRQVEAVKMLMRRGANPGARNLENELPCQLLPEGADAEKVRQVLRGRFVHM